MGRWGRGDDPTGRRYCYAERSAEAVKVAVVGLGLAGLETMRQLENAGVAVTGFEARERLGGRGYSIHLDGYRFEAGGEWIDADHHRVIALAKELQVELKEKPAAERWYWHGSDQCTTNSLWPELIEDQDSLEEDVRQLIHKKQSLPSSTLQQLLDSHATSDRSRWCLTEIYRSDEGDDPESIGLVGWLRAYENYLNREGDEASAMRFRNGISELMISIRNQIKGQIHLSHPVTKIVRTEDGWQLNDHPDERFDHVVVTVPTPVLRDIVVSPSHREGTQKVLDTLGMSRAIKVTFLFRDAWWKDLGWGGNLQYDGLLQQLWDGTLGGLPVLNAYVCGEDALAILSAASDGNFEDKVRREMFTLFPQSEASLVSVHLFDWVGDSYSKGAFSHFPPNFDFDALRTAWKPHHGLHYAGEHTAGWYGFFEGALESAERVCGEILNGND